jgi:hypothetical protein
LLQQPESEFDSAISSFESQPIKFVSFRSQGKLTTILQVIKPLQICSAVRTSSIPQAPTLAKPLRSQS